MNNTLRPWGLLVPFSFLGTLMCTLETRDDTLPFDDASGDADSDTDGDAGADGDADSEDTDTDDIYDEWDMEIDHIPTRMMLLQDISLSMEGVKWEQARPR